MFFLIPKQNINVFNKFFKNVFSFFLSLKFKHQLCLLKYQNDIFVHLKLLYVIMFQYVLQLCLSLLFVFEIQVLTTFTQISELTQLQ